MLTGWPLPRAITPRTSCAMGAHGSQVTTTTVIHTPAPRSVKASSISIDTPVARRATFVDGHAARPPTRCSPPAISERLGTPLAFRCLPGTVYLSTWPATISAPAPRHVTHPVTEPSAIAHTSTAP